MSHSRKRVATESRIAKFRVRTLQSVGEMLSLEDSETNSVKNEDHVIADGIRTNSTIFDRIIDVIKNPAEERDIGNDLQPLLTWLHQKVHTFRSQSLDVVRLILKECTFTTANIDDVIIKQGDHGDCCYVLLRGHVSVYINATLSDEEDVTKLVEIASRTSWRNEHGQLDRNKLGACVDHLEVGRSFGEMALLSRTCIRQATVVANERCDLLVVNRDLYNRSLHSTQAAEFGAKMRFVENHPLFQRWPQQHRRQMAMSISHRKVQFDQPIVRQGDPAQALYLVYRGHGKVVVDPALHVIQYPELQSLDVPVTRSAFIDSGRENVNDSINQSISLSRWNCVPGNGIDSKDRSMRKPLTEHTQVVKESNTVADQIIDSCRRRPARRISGQCHRLVEVSIVGANDIIGDIEFTLGLRSYVQSVLCTEQCDVFFLNARNYERLVIKKHPSTAEMIIGCVQLKLSSRIARLRFDHVPVFHELLRRIETIESGSFNDNTMPAGYQMGQQTYRKDKKADLFTSHDISSQNYTKSADIANIKRKLLAPRAGAPQVFLQSMLPNRRYDPSPRMNVATAPALRDGTSVSLLCSTVDGRPVQAINNIDKVRLPTISHYGRSQTDLTVGNSHNDRQYRLHREPAADDVPVVVVDEEVNHPADVAIDDSDFFYRTNVPADVEEQAVNDGPQLRPVDRKNYNGFVGVTESSDKMLAGLETRIGSWHMKVITSPACIQPVSSPRQFRPLVVRLKRASLEGKEPPIGNKVIVRRKRPLPSQRSTASSERQCHDPVASLLSRKDNTPGSVVRMLLSGKKFATCKDIIDEMLL